MTTEEWQELERLCHKVLEDVTVASHEVIGEAIRTTGAFAAAVQVYEAKRQYPDTDATTEAR